MFCKKKSRLQEVQESVGTRAHDLGERAGDTLHAAQDTLHEVLEHAPEKIEDLKHSASDALHGASEVLHEAASRVAGVAQSAVSSLGAKADSLKSKADEVKTGAVKSAGKMKKQRERQAHGLVDEAQRKLHQKKVELAKAYVPEIVVENSSQKWLWLGVGILIGAVLGVLLAPSTGRRSRALIKDKLARGSGAVSDLGESVASRAEDLSQRAKGAAHEMVAKHSGEGMDEAADDVTIADRVRSELGRLEKQFGVERINVDSCDGVVTLRGPVHEAGAAEVLVAAAQKVPGVREVRNELAIESSEQSFVG